MEDSTRQFFKSALLRKSVEQKLELEIRFTDVTPVTFQCLINYMKNTDKPCFYHEQTDKIINQLRIVTSSTGKSSTVLKKVQLDRLYTDHYSIVLCSETALGSNVEIPASSNASKIRNKHRWSFLISNVRLDLTKVVDDEHCVSHEVELEILDTATKQTLQRVDHIINLVNSILGSTDLKKCLPCHFKANRFVGAMPTTVTRENIHLLSKFPHYVTPKLDGNRVALVLDHDSKFILVDRNQKTQVFQSAIDWYANNKVPFDLSSFKNSTFDAEYSQDQVHIFDVIFYRNKDLRKDTNACLPNRINLMNEFVANAANPYIKIKPYFECDTPNTEMNVYRVMEENRDNKWDGLIFTRSNTSYPTVSRTMDVLKWKPLQSQSIDFLITKTNQGKAGFQTWLLYLRYGNQTCKLFKSLPHILVPFEIGNLFENHSVVECTWDEDEYTFKPTRSRPDKTYPNFFTSAQDVLDAIKQPLFISLKQNAIKNSPTLSPMRRRHNGIKRQLINSMVSFAATKQNLDVLDIACGRGGDLAKWMSYESNLSSYTGTDIDDESLTEARRRQIKMQNKVPNVPFQFIKMDWTQDILPTTTKLFNMVTCQFALHYFWKSKSVWNHFITEVNRLTIPGCLFSCCLFEANNVLSYLKNRRLVRAFDPDGTGFMLHLLECGFSINDVTSSPTYGVPLNVCLYGDKDVIMKNATLEYLVFAGDLVFAMLEAGWDLVLCEPFNQCDISSLESLTLTQQQFSNLNYSYMFRRR